MFVLDDLVCRAANYNYGISLHHAQVCTYLNTVSGYLTLECTT